MRSMRPVPITSSLVIAVAALLVTACASNAPPGGSAREGRPSPRVAAAEADGPGVDPPADLANRAAPEPRVEPLLPGGANKPYEAFGRAYVPLTRDVPFRERGLASWYGRKFHGRKTASGEIYDMYALTAAHPTLPIPSYARITNPANGREVLIRVNDRGPFIAGRIVDLSYAAAVKLDVLRGVAPVELERITFDEIQSGAWRRGQDSTQVAVAPSAVEPVPVVPVPARTIELVAAAKEDLEPVPVKPSPSAPARGFWVQLGAFREARGADTFRNRAGAEVEGLAPLLAVFSDASLLRVQAGPFASRAAADEIAARLRQALGVVPIVVERR